MTDYRNFRFNKLRTKEFSHILLLLYWPIYGLLFLWVERFANFDYNYIYCFLDDLIPFCEYFIIPYYFWFVYLIGMLVYTFFFDTECFRKFMIYIILTYTTAILIYIIYPNAQNLRPENIERDNIFTRVVGYLYGFDTNTNVCPSIHVLGSMAVFFAAINTERIKSFWIKALFLALTVLISISTVFLKQHSVIDILVAVPIGILFYFPAFRPELFHIKRKNPQGEAYENSGNN